MIFWFHPDTLEEIEHAVAYYEERQSGLGLDLLDEIYATVARIAEYPDAWSSASHNTRRCLINRFPLGIIYQNVSGTLRIIALAHLQHRPAYWKDRR